MILATPHAWKAVDEPPSRNPIHWPRAVADWLCSDREDCRAFRQRRATTVHRNCRRICVWLWIFAGAVVAVWPGVAVIMGTVLAATFLCFALLDR